MLALGCLAWWLYTELFTPPPRGIFASGTIESEDVSIASEVAGRVTELLAEEGDTVRSGDVLVRLDDSCCSCSTGWRRSPSGSRWSPVG